jgi:carboxymethylenebutenolidase
MAHEPAAIVTTPSAAALFEAHMQAELHADLEATMATMVDDPHLLNLASGSGGEGAAGVREFYATKLIGQFFPPDVEFISISRTMDQERLVDELLIRFTHSQAIGQLLPSLAPTGRRAARLHRQGLSPAGPPLKNDRCRP